MAVTRKQFINAAADTQNSYWIADTAGEAVAGAVEGDLKYAKDTDLVYSYDGANWDATGGGTVAASAVTVADSGGYYTATDVEAALVEIATLPGPVQFGSGRDGAMTLDGANYYAALTKTSGTVYTMLHDLHCTDLTVSAGVTLRTVGCRIFVQGTLTVDGTIEWEGAAASGVTNGASETSTGVFDSTKQGGAGKTNSATDGNNGTAGTTSGTLGPGAGGSGGPGGSGLEGGAPGNCSFPTALGGGVYTLDTDPRFAHLYKSAAGTVVGAGGGTGGGGGAGAASGVSGGGGAGGGVIAIYAHIINVTATGIISANGGNGGAASGTGPCGGGGGGGGGVIILDYDSYTNAGTVRANGGTGGAGSGTPVLTGAAAPFAASFNDSTDSQFYRPGGGGATGSRPVFWVVFNTKSGGGDVPDYARAVDSSLSPSSYKPLVQVDTVTNGDLRMTLYRAREIDGNGIGLDLGFPAVQTSIGVQQLGFGAGVVPDGITQSLTGTATGVNTLVITLPSTPTTAGITMGVFGVGANVVITQGAGFTSLSQTIISTPGGQLRSEYGLGTVDATVDATTAGNQTWVGIAWECRASGNGENGLAGVIRQFQRL